MADNTGNVSAKNFSTDIPQKNSSSFHVKGMGNADWGIKNRLARIFNRESGKTLMLAFDHGYIMGPTSGIERLDLSIPPLVDHTDCLMGTRGAIRTIIPPESDKPIALRASAGSTILTELNNECIIDIEDAIRLNACAMAVMVAIGSRDFEGLTVKNLYRMCDLGNKYNVPVLGVNAVGKELVRDWKYLALAVRVIAENGAHIVKTYYCDEGFEKVTAGCPVPIVVAGGKKLPEKDALELAYKAIQGGASGLDMGRNIFQAESPLAMLEAVALIVHKGETSQKAYEYYQESKSR